MKNKKNKKISLSLKYRKKHIRLNIIGMEIGPSVFDGFKFKIETKSKQFNKLRKFMASHFSNIHVICIRFKISYSNKKYCKFDGLITAKEFDDKYKILTMNIKPVSGIFIYD